MKTSRPAGKAAAPAESIADKPNETSDKSPGEGSADADGPSGDETPDKAASRKDRLEPRRAPQQTEAWKKPYAKRSGQEGVNRALDRVTGIKQL